jgi:hypothetical protein
MVCVSGFDGELLSLVWSGMLLSDEELCVGGGRVRGGDNDVEGTEMEVRSSGSVGDNIMGVVGIGGV